LQRQEDAKHLFTGDYNLLNRLMTLHEFIENRGLGGWNGYVPFSNGTENEKTPLGVATEGAKEQLRYRTTVLDVINVFFD